MFTCIITFHHTVIYVARGLFLLGYLITKLSEKVIIVENVILNTFTVMSLGLKQKDFAL